MSDSYKPSGHTSVAPYLLSYSMLWAREGGSFGPGQ
jgi:hypothetical protein